MLHIRPFGSSRWVMVSGRYESGFIIGPLDLLKKTILWVWIGHHSVYDQII
jgi:hypothetical protein